MLLVRLSRGESAASVGRHYDVNEYTVSYIQKNEKAIHDSISASAVSSTKAVTHARDVHIVRMEKALSIWIKENVQKSMPLSGLLIREKAKQINYHLAGAGVGASMSDAPSDDGTSSMSSFTASKGWFHRFKEQYCLKNVKFTGERASVDHEAEKTFPAQLARLIEGKGYLPEQVFNADETGLFWKKMSTRTFILKRKETASGFEAAKDRVSLLLCANAKGDLMLKPMMLYHSLNPPALKGKNKQTLPMFWKANRKSWVMAAIFLDWFHNCFVPQVERYMVGKNLAFKVLLLLNNASGHPANLDVAHPNIEVIFMPPNTTSLIQPHDQGVISTYKTYYTRRTFRRILDAMESDPGHTVRQCWKEFNISHCIGAIKESLDELGGEGFDDMQPEELEDLIASHGDKLTKEELEAITMVSKEETGSDEEQVPRSNLTVPLLG
uniref:tigger transposable element-derived protein 1-like n=1 Tax=Myxine glutinosa TaxID=7769 RepID=UPI00358F1F1B